MDDPNHLKIEFGRWLKARASGWGLPALIAIVFLVVAGSVLEHAVSTGIGG